eukprot:1394243-Amorphochlora_amoeboformis.AAC.1
MLSKFSARSTLLLASVFAVLFMLLAGEHFHLSAHKEAAEATHSVESVVMKMGDATNNLMHKFPTHLMDFGTLDLTGS